MPAVLQALFCMGNIWDRNKAEYIEKDQEFLSGMFFGTTLRGEG